MIVGEYLEQLTAQRLAIFAELDHIDEAMVWERPAPETWCIGEDLDHLRVINMSMLRFFRLAWAIEAPLVGWRCHKPYHADIDNVYKRPGFPLNVGWLWSPRYTPSSPVSLAVLRANLVDVHGEIARFYRDKEQDRLGQVRLFDPVIGWLNLIQGLRVGLYHDELHFESIRAVLAVAR
jgi:hypothetical protein